MKRTETVVKEQMDAIHRGNVPIRNGGEIEPGYKPDRVYEVGNNLLIVEIETSTDRKKHLGNYIKAHEYLNRVNKSGEVLIIIQERDNTKLESIYNQVSKYYQWITGLGAKKLPIQIITIDQITNAKDKNIGLFTKAFKRIGKKL